jgi:site-specific recombinase XerD
VIETYRYDLKRAFSTLYNKPAVSIKGRELSECLKLLAESGHAKSSVDRAARYIRQAYKELYTKGGVDMSIRPTDRMIMPRAAAYTYKEEPKKAYEFCDLLKLEDAVKQEKEKETRENFTAALGILAVTGFRISELLGICKEDITIAPDQKSLTISINKTAKFCTVKDNTENPGKGWYVRHRTKSKSSERNIPIVEPATIEAIAVLLKREHPAAEQKEEKFSFLFATKSGNPITKSSFGTVFRRIRKRAGCEIKVHEYRHSLATIFDNNGKNESQSSRFLGHKKDVFQNVYVHATDSAHRELATWLADQKAKAVKTAVTTPTPAKVKPTGTDA